jgi:hypothetical protein
MNDDDAARLCGVGNGGDSSFWICEVFDYVDGKDQIKVMVKGNGILHITLFENPFWLSIAGLLDGVMGDVYSR